MTVATARLALCAPVASLAASLTRRAAPCVPLATPRARLAAIRSGA